MADPMVLAELRQVILRSQRPADIPARLVAIDGHGGAGKSTLAAQLSLQLDAEIIHTDDFASDDEPLDWWPRLIRDVLDPIKHGATVVRYRRGHGLEVRQPVTDVMLLEGVSAARTEFRPYLSYAIWVETPRALCLRRGSERDWAAFDGQLEDWFEEEDEYIARDRPRAYVDRVVRGW